VRLLLTFLPVRTPSIILTLPLEWKSVASYFGETFLVVILGLKALALSLESLILPSLGLWFLSAVASWVLLLISIAVLLFGLYSWLVSSKLSILSLLLDAESRVY
jgi:hypothetical protein